MVGQTNRCGNLLLNAGCVERDPGGLASRLTRPVMGPGQGPSTRHTLAYSSAPLVVDGRGCNRDPRWVGVHGGMKFYRGAARAARAYVERDRSRADDYYLAEGSGGAAGPDLRRRPTGRRDGR
jgi:hypothetical protein